MTLDASTEGKLFTDAPRTDGVSLGNNSSPSDGGGLERTAQDSNSPAAHQTPTKSEEPKLNARAVDTNDDARAILHTLASQPARPPVAVVVERRVNDELTLRTAGEWMRVTTDEAAALVMALLADGAVHERWLHGRGGK